jgi:hypothetical protein
MRYELEYVQFSLSPDRKPIGERKVRVFRGNSMDDLIAQKKMYLSEGIVTDMYGRKFGRQEVRWSQVSESEDWPKRVRLTETI